MQLNSAHNDPIIAGKCAYNSQCRLIGRLIDLID